MSTPPQRPPAVSPRGGAAGGPAEPDPRRPLGSATGGGAGGSGGLLAEARAFAALAAPMIVSRIGVAAMGIADGVMLARYASEQLAVLGLADALIGRLLDISMMFVTAGLALAAQARASGGDAARAVGTVWHNSLALAALAGLLGLAFGFGGTALLTALGQPAALVPAAGQVVAVLALGVLPALVALASAGLLEALGRPVGVAVAVVLANVLNVALNAWFIYGGAGVPALGAVGAAWATTLVRMALAAVLVAGVWWLAERQRYALRERFGAAAWRAGREQRARGWAGAANVGVLALLSLGMPVMAGWLGPEAVAQVTALWLALAPVMVVAWGLGDAAGLRVAALHGRADGPGELRRTGLRLALLLLAVTLAIATAYALAPQAMVRWAAHEPALVAGVVPLLGLGLAALVADAMSILHSSMLRSLGVLRGPFIVHALSGLVLLPLAWMLAFGQGWGVKGLLAAHVGVAALRALALAWMYDRCAAGHDGRRAALPVSASA